MLAEIQPVVYPLGTAGLLVLSAIPAATRLTEQIEDKRYAKRLEEYKFHGEIGRERILNLQIFDFAERLNRNFVNEYGNALLTPESQVIDWMRETSVWKGEYNQWGRRDIGLERIAEGRDEFVVLSEKRLLYDRRRHPRTIEYYNDIAVVRTIDKQKMPIWAIVQADTEEQDLFRVGVFHTEDDRVGIHTFRYDPATDLYNEAYDLDGAHLFEGREVIDVDSEMIQAGLSQ